MIDEGTYTAKVVSSGITESKSGDPMATITFDIDINGQTKQMSYYGSFKDGARKHTIKALLVCGLKGNNPAGDLEIGKEVQVVVGTEEYEGKTRTKIKWVNAIGAAVNVIDSDLAKSKLSALEGAVMAARQDLKIQDPDDSIPF